MKTILKNIIYTAAAIVVLSGCKKEGFLQDGSVTEGDIFEEQVWENDIYARGVLNSAYTHLQDGYNIDGNGALLASGSDEAVNSNLASGVNVFNNGTWSPVRAFDDQYGDLYVGLRKVNLFLINAPTAVIIPRDGLTFQQDVARLRGEAFFLRAMYHFELVKRYGGVVLATRVFDRLEELNLPQNSFQECVNQIVLDCDSAIATLPEWTQSWGTGDRGRATKTAAMALKARMLLYAASPLNNPTADLTKWQLAADAAKTLINLNRHSLRPTYVSVFNFNQAAYNNEVIFATPATNRLDIETNNAPISYDGALGRTNPTQELVDAFGMANGKSISDPTSGYNPNNPYAGRDPRLSIIINYNGLNFKSKPVETFVGGKDGLNLNVNATKTGYYMRKFLSEAVIWNTASNSSVRRPWVLFRYAEVLLNYAEALNEAQGPVADVYKYLNEVRRRPDVNLPLLVAGAPLLSKEQMRELIRNERRVELSFEGHRFYDVRRWRQGDLYFNKPVTGMRITKQTNGSFLYERFTVENRVFSDKNYRFPFSIVDINRQPALVQNPGWQ